MNIDASRDTIRAIGAAIKLAALLDDRVAQPDKARIAAWAEQVQRHRLTEQDLLDAVQDFYDRGQDRAIGIGDMVDHGRARKRARLEREPDEQREARQAEREAMAPGYARHR
jgi:hypothetical protein